MLTKFYTCHEAAQILRLATSTIYGLVHQRRITYRKHGSRVMFTEDDLSNFSKSNEVQALNIESFLPQQNSVKQYSPSKTTQRSLKTEYTVGRRSFRKETDDGYHSKDS